MLPGQLNIIKSTANMVNFENISIDNFLTKK